MSYSKEKKQETPDVQEVQDNTVDNGEMTIADDTDKNNNEISL